MTVSVRDLSDGCLAPLPPWPGQASAYMVRPARLAGNTGEEGGGLGAGVV